MAEEMLQEPPNGALGLLTLKTPAAHEHEPRQVLARRSDLETDPDERYRWQISGEAGWLTWAGVCAAGTFERLYRQYELDAAVRAAQVEVVGQHQIEDGGYCRSCGVHHSPAEIERARAREEGLDADG